MRRILRNNLPLAFTPLEIGCQRQPSDTFGVLSLTGLRFYLILSYAKNLKSKFFKNYTANREFYLNLVNSAGSSELKLRNFLVWGWKIPNSKACRAKRGKSGCAAVPYLESPNIGWPKCARCTRN